MDADTLSNGALFAVEIDLRDGDDEDVEIEGRVSDLDPGAQSFRIHAFVIRAHAGSLIYEETDTGVQAHAFTDLTAGMRVKIEADWTAGEPLAPDEIRLLPTNTDDDVEIEARVASVSPATGQFVLLDQTVTFGGTTQIDGRRSGEAPETVAQSGIRRDDDEPQFAPLRFGQVLVGGRTGLGLEFDRDRDLDTGTGDSTNRLRQATQVEVSTAIDIRCIPFKEVVETHGRQ